MTKFLKELYQNPNHFTQLQKTEGNEICSKKMKDEKGVKSFGRHVVSSSQPKQQKQKQRSSPTAGGGAKLTTTGKQKEFPQLFVFDLIGSVLKEDYSISRSMCRAFERTGFRGVLTEDTFNRLQGLPKQEAIRMVWDQIIYTQKLEFDLKHFKYHIPERTRDLEEKIRKNTDTTYQEFRSQLCRYYAENPPCPVDGVETIFAWLKRSQCQIAFNTAFEEKIASQIFRQVGWEHVGPVVTADQVRDPRPAGGQIREAMRLTGVSNPKSVAYLGDTIADKSSARDAGVGHCFLSLWGATPLSAFRTDSLPWIEGDTQYSFVVEQEGKTPFYYHYLTTIDQLPQTLAGCDFSSGNV